MVPHLIHDTFASPFRIVVAGRANARVHVDMPVFYRVTQGRVHLVKLRLSSHAIVTVRRSRSVVQRSRLLVQTDLTSLAEILATSCCLVDDTHVPHCAMKGHVENAWSSYLASVYVGRQVGS